MKLVRIILAGSFIFIICISSASARHRFFVPYFNLSSGFEGFSIGCKYLDYKFLKRDQVLNFEASYSFKYKQQYYVADFYRFLKNGQSLRFYLAYENAYRGFYGLYNDSYLAFEGVYRNIDRYFSFSYGKRLGKYNSLTVGYTFEDSDVIVENRYGIFSLDKFTGEDGGRTNSVYLSLNRTKVDNYYNPHCGYNMSFLGRWHSKYVGSNYDFNTYNLSLRGYLPLGKTTLASMINWGWQNGTVPFYKMLSLGGSSALRGYVSNRFRGKGLVNTSLEWRSPLFKPFMVLGYNLKLQGAVFFDSGRVASSFQTLGVYDWHSSYGAGFRIIADDKFIIRFDLANSSESLSYYFVFDHSF